MAAAAASSELTLVLALVWALEAQPERAKTKTAIIRKEITLDI
jgi:hypothetical protein